jgi:hypothetical protein
VIVEKDGGEQLDLSCKNEEILHRVKEERNILHTVKKEKTKLIGHIMLRIGLLNTNY